MNIIIILSIIIIGLFALIGFTSLPSAYTVTESLTDSSDCNNSSWPSTTSEKFTTETINTEQSYYPNVLSSYCHILLLQSYDPNSAIMKEGNIFNPFPEDSNDSEKNYKKITNLTTAVNTARWWRDQVFFETSPGFFIQKKTEDGDTYYAINIFKDNKSNSSLTTNNNINTFLTKLSPTD